MKTSTNFLTHLLTISLLLGSTIFTSCGSDDTDTYPSNSINTLTANAGPDQTIQENTLVTLDGNSSSDTNGGIFEYSWRILTEPSGSTVMLDNSNTSSPSFTPTTAGVYTIELEISNTDFESTDTVNITVTSANIDAEIVELGGSIDEDIVLVNRIDTPGIADYCVTSNINLNAIMTIEPGVELHFEADLSFRVSGRDGGILIAKGTADDHIVFTAKNTSVPWRGIGFIASDDFRNEMDYVDISYAGIDDLSNIDRRAALGISSFSALKFTNSTISNSAEIGMFVEDDVELSFANNRFENNAEPPLVLPANLVGELDSISQFSLNNGENIIEITDRFVNSSEPTFWKKMDDNTPYVITEGIVVETELNIEPGVELLFEADNSFRVDNNGILIAKGTKELPIIFTAKESTLPWRGIGIFSDSTRNIIDYGEISYAGVDTVFILDEKAAIGIGGFDSLALTNSTISNSVSNGMLVESSANLLEFSNNHFENNAETPLIITAEQVHQLDNASTFGLTNGNNYVEMLGAFLSNSEELTWSAFNDGTPFFLSGNLNFQSGFGGLNITPNVKIMVGSDLSIRVDNAFLSAKGESTESMVTFTAFDPALPWQGISFLTSNIRNELDFVEVSYAGSDVLGNIDVAANVGIGAFDQLRVTNSIISNGLGYGFSIDNRSPEFNADLLTINTIINNALGPVFFEM